MLSPEVRAASRAARSRSAPRHQRLDALVDIAEPLFEPHHRLAVGGEAEMPGLDDAGMHRADRNLVQAFAFDRAGRRSASRLRPAPALVRAKRMRDVPAAVVEPGPRGPAAPSAASPIEIVDRALEPDGRRMQRADGGKAAVRASERDDGDLAGRSSSSAMWTVAGIAPEARAASQSAGCELRRRHAASRPSVDDDARPRPMAVDAVALRAMMSVSGRHGV